MIDALLNPVEKGDIIINFDDSYYSGGIGIVTGATKIGRIKYLSIRPKFNYQRDGQGNNVGREITGWDMSSTYVKKGNVVKVDLEAVVEYFERHMQMVSGNYDYINVEQEVDALRNHLEEIL